MKTVTVYCKRVCLHCCLGLGSNLFEEGDDARVEVSECVLVFVHN